MPGPVPLHNAIPVSATAVELAPARESRRGMTIYNDSTQSLYVKYSVDVTTTSFAIKIPPDWYATMPWGEIYAGKMWGVWGGVDPGRFAQVTELVS